MTKNYTIENPEGDTQDIRVHELTYAVGLMFPGYIDNYGTSCLVTISLDEHGTPVLTIWADKSQEDPTHVISLENAKE